MSLGKVAGGNEIDTNLRVLKTWSPIQTPSSSDRLTHSSKHTQRESDGTEKFADFYCSVTEPQEFTQKKKKKGFTGGLGFVSIHKSRMPLKRSVGTV